MLKAIWISQKELFTVSRPALLSLEGYGCLYLIFSCFHLFCLIFCGEQDLQDQLYPELLLLYQQYISINLQTSSQKTILPQRLPKLSLPPTPTFCTCNQRP